MLLSQFFFCILIAIFFAIMENSYEFNYCGGCVDEVQGLSVYENVYYIAPYLTSYNGSGLFYHQTELVYYPIYYVQPSYPAFYPLIPVLYSTLYCYQTEFVPVSPGYYVPHYSLPTNAYNISDVYQDPANESNLIYSSVEQKTPTFEEFDSGLCYPENGFPDDYDSCATFVEPVSEVNGSFHLYYDEGPEKLNGDPKDEQNDDEANSGASDNTVNNDIVSSTPDIHGSATPQLIDEDQSCTINIDPCEEDADRIFLERISAVDIVELKGHIDRAYCELKENLFKDVDSGYAGMREFLQDVKFRWDRVLPTILEKEKRKKTFNMEQYYFSDVDALCIPKGLDEAETYILFQLLGSMDMSQLKSFMKKSYKKNKRNVYKKECKGYTKVKRLLNKLKWRHSRLCSIHEGEELKVTEEEFKQNFIKSLRNITSESSRNLNYLLFVLNKSVATSTSTSEEEEEDASNEEDITPVCQRFIENPQVYVSSSDSVEVDVSNTQDISLSKGKLCTEYQKTNKDIHVDVSSSYKAADSLNDPVPPKTDASLSLDSVHKDAPNTQGISISKKNFQMELQKDIEYHHHAVSSSYIAANCENDAVIPNTEVLFGKEDCSSDSFKENIPNTQDIPTNIGQLEVESQKITEDLQLDGSSSYVKDDSEKDPVPHEKDLSLNEEYFGVEKIEETTISTSSVDDVEEYERPFIPPVIELDSASYTSFKEEELYPASMTITKEQHLEVPSPDGEVDKSSDPPPVTLEPAASEKCHQKKRFSSLRKFLSRICCCKKRPPP